MNHSSRIQALKGIFREELKETKDGVYLLFHSNYGSTINTEETPMDSPGTGQEGPTDRTHSTARSQVRKCCLKKR